MSVQSIDDFKLEVERYLAVLAGNFDADYYPRNVHGQILTFAKRMPVTFDFPRGDATPFIEMQNGQFHFVISERGREFKRVSGNSDEILALLFEGIASDLASNFEVRHRSDGQDSRRVCFSKQIELLTLLDARWARSVSEKQQKILQQFPFADNS